MIRAFTLVFVTLFTSALHAKTLKLAVTRSFNNSGLSDVLLPEIKKDTGVAVQLLIVGTGQALRLGEAGDVDAILVHSQKAKDAFVTTGFGTHRREIMYNDFVLIGPAGDPAGVGAASDALMRCNALQLLRAHLPSAVMTAAPTKRSSHCGREWVWIPRHFPTGTNPSAQE